MSSKITAYRVFIASPSGLQRERTAFRELVIEYNESDALRRGVLFIPVGWEDTLSGLGRPQDLINDDLRCCDYFVLLLWDRWGTHTGSSDCDISGTYEEFCKAKELLADRSLPMRQIIAFFKAVSPDKLSDPGEQLRRVTEFKARIEHSKELLFTTFDDVDAFARHFRNHLARWLYEHEQGDNARVPSIASTTQPPLLAPFTHGFFGEGSAVFRNPAIAKVLSNAETAATAGRHTEAETEFSKAVTAGNDPEAFSSFGRFLLRRGRFKQAEEMYQRLLELSGAHSHQWAGVAWGSLGLISHFLGHLGEAERQFRRSIEAYQATGDQGAMAAVLGRLGLVLLALGDFDAAESAHNEALQLDYAGHNQLGVAVAYRDLGRVKWLRSDISAAERLIRHALEIDTRFDHKEGIAADLSELGRIFLEQRDFDGAEKAHKDALSLFKKLDLLVRANTELAALAAVYQRSGNLEEAENLVLQAMAVNEQVGRLEDMASNYRLLGYINFSRANVIEAGRWLAKAYRLYAKIGMSRDAQELERLLHSQQLRT